MLMQPMHDAWVWSASVAWELQMLQPTFQRNLCGPTGYGGGLVGEGLVVRLCTPGAAPSLICHKDVLSTMETPKTIRLAVVRCSRAVRSIGDN